MDRRADRRVFARVPLEVNVDIASEDDEERWVVSRDISEGGMRLGFVSLPTYTPLQLTFALPEKGEEEAPPPFVVQCEVAWRRMSSTGIRFSTLSLEERARLRAFLESRAQA
jgi:hypothetical protein